MDILNRLAKSKFRSRFKLRAKELEYINEKGLDKIKSHAEGLIIFKILLLTNFQNNRASFSAMIL